MGAWRGNKHSNGCLCQVEADAALSADHGPVGPLSRVVWPLTTGLNWTGQKCNAHRHLWLRKGLRPLHNKKPHAFLQNWVVCAVCMCVREPGEASWDSFQNLVSHGLMQIAVCQGLHKARKANSAIPHQREVHCGACHEVVHQLGSEVVGLRVQGCEEGPGPMHQPQVANCACRSWGP